MPTPSLSSRAGPLQARRPTTSPTKQHRPLPRVDGRESAPPAAACSVPAAACRRTAAPHGVIPYAPSLSAGAAVQQAVRRSSSRLQRTSLAVDTQEAAKQPALVSSPVAPQPPAPFRQSRPSHLELLLQYLHAVAAECLDSAAAEVLDAALAALRQRRRQRKGVKPTPPAPAGVASSGRPQVRRLASTSTAAATGAEVASSSSNSATVAALVAACEAPTVETAVEILLANHDEAAQDSLSSVVAVAAVELRAARGPLCGDDLLLLDAAVAAGHPGALLRAGLCLRDGCEGGAVPVDLSAALTYVEAAAATGYVPALHEMGVIYETGFVTAEAALQPDWGEAVRWYHRAAVAGHVASQLNLGKLLLTAAEEQGASAVASTAELGDLRQRSREWMEQAARDGCEEAVRLLKRM